VVFKMRFVVPWIVIALVSGVVTASQASTPRCFGKKPTIMGTGSHDTLVGSTKADVIVGGSGSDTILGRGGDDLICAGPGDDHVSGGTETDKLRGGRGTDILYTRGVFHCFDECASPAQGCPEWFDEFAYGGRGDDVLLGEYERDIFKGGRGNDVLIPRGTVHVYCQRHERLLGGSGNDDLISRPRTLPNVSLIESFALFRGGPGSDSFFGARTFDGDNVVSYRRAPRGVHVDLDRGVARGEGNDRMIGMSRVSGSAFDDVLLASGAAWLRNRDYSGPGSGLIGWGGNDVLVGNINRDRLRGGRGSDAIDARDNRAGDNVSGGSGSDSCQIDQGDTSKNCEGP
jgi:Ca2+-binding RTX toxin-like protein